MKKLFLFITVICLLVFGFSQKQIPSRTELLRSYQSANKLLLKAEQLSEQTNDDEILQKKADEVYIDAQQSFYRISTDIKKAGYDSLLFFIHLNTAYISFYLNDPVPAKSAYLEAFLLKKYLPLIEDSFLFLPTIYTGGIYYNENKFDSALYYYKQAEKILDGSKKQLDGSQRLYNRLGAMYYETGNFRQARNYFEKAIAILDSNNKNNKSFLDNYLINLATLQVKLEEFDLAKKIYKKVLLSGNYNNEVYHNLGIISLKEEGYNEALSYFKKVKYENSKKNIELLYNISMCWTGLNNKDSANNYITKATEENKRWFGNSKSTSLGLILKFKADIAKAAQDYHQSLLFNQQAIIQFDNNFSASDSTKNPVEFSGVFSYINLFNTISSKADVFEKIYSKEKKKIHLLNALAAYQSAFNLADFVEKTYDSDEARLFLGKIKYTVHSRPIDISLHLYELTKDKKYLEIAWNFDQRNKASLLSLNLLENEWKEKLTGDNELLKQESSLKKTITRLLLKVQNNTDSSQIAQLYAQLRDKEIELGKVQVRINSSPEMELVSQTKKIPAISELQQQLDKSSAIISYHLSETKILIFYLTADSINYDHVVLSKELIDSITHFRNILQHTVPGEKYKGLNNSKYLYQQLLNPVIPHLSGIENLIIIPDDELHYLPFDALQNNKEEFVVQNFTVQYLYSASLFQPNNKKQTYSNILGFAPFASKGITDSTGTEFKRLDYSKVEIEQPNEEALIDTLATKKKFLSLTNKYSVIHLATHAAVNNNDPNRSYIAFYPDNNDFLLYAPEIYNLNLDSTQLIILSACETGTGQLVKGEGLMSLSRAFSYAGCSNIIASLWKAEDKSTSFIIKRLYHYLNKGHSKAKALQKAKIDLLNNKEIAPSLKSPNYWGHLIYIGDYESDNTTIKKPWFIIFICLFLAGALFFIMRRKSATKKK